MIQEGLLWFDDSPTRSMVDKVGNAVQRYQQKYGHAPDVCYVHPGLMPEHEVSIGPVKVLPAPTVLLHHFWLGTTATKKQVTGSQENAVAVASEG